MRPECDEILRLFGDRLRELRTARDLSQERLAELAGLDRNYVGQIERAERNVALVNIVRIAKALGVEPAALFAVHGGERRQITVRCRAGFARFVRLGFDRLVLRRSDRRQ
jgi:transcriptional regulator with XRE-family HTH domain